MRTQKRNRQKMYYSCPDETTPVYETDDEGNIIYVTVDGKSVPVDTGETKTTYKEPVEFRGAIFSQLENAIVRAWGSDNSKNYAVLVVDKDKYPELVNGVRIWRKSEIAYKEGYVDKDSADYQIEGTLDEELNEDSYYLRKLDHEDSSDE